MQITSNKINAFFLLVHPEKLEGVLFNEFINTLEKEQDKSKFQRRIIIITSQESEFAKKNSLFENFKEFKFPKENKFCSHNHYKWFTSEVKIYNKGSVKVLV